MKTIKSISALLLIAAVYSGCAGDHSAQSGKDTAENTYYVSPDSAKLDTGVTKSRENSANGGIFLVKKTATAKRDSAALSN
jgi:hypothetical protein